MSNNQQGNNEFNQDGQDDVSQEGTSYMMEGYTPLSFNMNALAVSDDIDSDVESGDGMIATGYYQLDPENRPNGVKTHVGEFTPQVTAGAQDEESDSDSDGLVPDDFVALAEQALKGLDDEHRVTLGRSETGKWNNSTVPTSLPNGILDINEDAADASKDLALDKQKTDVTHVSFEFDFPSIGIHVESKNEKDISSAAATSRKFPAARMTTSKKGTGKQPNEAANANAIQEAMRAIRKSAPKLASSLDERASSSSTAAAYKSAAGSSYHAIINSTCLAIKSRNESFNPDQKLSIHPVIPQGPLAAFRRNTQKARCAAHNLSRCATLSEAIYRLWPLICFRKKLSALNESVWTSTNQQQYILHARELTIHIIGADDVECSSEDSVRNSVGAFVRWLDAALKSGVLLDSLCGETSNKNDGISLTIEFSGPNMPEAMIGKTLDMLPHTQTNNASKGIVAATCVFRRCAYHHSSQNADLTIAFNAGIW